MSGTLTQFGIVNESVYGTAVAVTKFYEIISEDFKGNYGRLQAEALSSAYVDRSDRFSINKKGAAGSVTLEPLTKGFGHWLQYMLGAKATTGPTETDCYTHTGTIGNLYGKSLTVQVGRAQQDGTVKPWTYEGGKVTSFEFSNQVDQTLRCVIGMDFENESNADSPAGAYILQSQSLPTPAEVFTWAGGTISIGGSAYDINEVSIKVDNALKTDRFYINKATPGKREPTQDGKRQIEWSFRAPYTDNALWEKVSSATIAGSVATLTASWEGLTLIGTTIYPKITISIPVAMFNEGGPVVSGPGELEATYTGKGLYNGTDSAISIEYISEDVTII
jgi:hypothetical protein